MSAWEYVQHMSVSEATRWYLLIVFVVLCVVGQWLERE